MKTRLAKWWEFRCPSTDPRYPDDEILETCYSEESVLKELENEPLGKNAEDEFLVECQRVDLAVVPKKKRKGKK